MSNHENSRLGKCYFLKAGERCGCQCYRANSQDNFICDVCFHDSGFHERENIPAASAVPTRGIPTSTVSGPAAAQNSLLNQVLTGQALEKQSIANELSQTFTRRNLVNSSVRSSRRNNQGSLRNFDPVQGAAHYNMYVGRNKRREEVVRETLVQAILLPDIGHELSSPIASQDK